MYNEKLAQEGVEELMLAIPPRQYKMQRIGNMRAIVSFDEARTLILMRFDMKIGDVVHGLNYEIPEILGKPLQKYVDEQSEKAKKILEESW